MGVFGKDFDTIDNILPESLRNVVRFPSLSLRLSVSLHLLIYSSL